MEKTTTTNTTSVEWLKGDDSGLMPMIKFEWTDFKGNPRKAHFCNFRRYSWCWSYAASAASGSGFSGVVYANGHSGGLRAESKAQVVRETLIRAIAEMTGKDMAFRSIVYSKPVSRLLESLLEDALEYVQRHEALHAEAPIRNPNYYMAPRGMRIAD